MSWITIVWSMNAAACLTLAGIYLVVWCKQRDDWVHLLFSCSAVAAAAVAGFELAMLRTDTVGQYEALVRWIHVPVWVLTVCFVAFVRRYLHAGRTWLAWSIYGLRTVVLILNFILMPNINFLAITKIRHLSWWGGEIVSLPIGMPNPWGMLSLASLLLLLIFCIDATVTVWRRGDRRRALIVGGGMIFGTIVAWHVPLVIWGVLNIPFFLCFAYSGIVLAMSYELSNDMLQTAHLARQLEASETDLREMKQRMELAASAAELGMWMWDIVRDEIWITDKGRALFGLVPSEKVDFNRFRNRIHPEDRESVLQLLENSLRTGAEYRSEYRAVLPNGQIRWIAGRGHVECDGDGQPVRMRGCSLDITRRKQAELEAACHRNEMAHLSRVTMLGELSGSLAHELNQPLAAILSNAQAAQQFLKEDVFDVNELRQVLTEIVAEDKRAAEVIRHVRLLFRKGEVGQHFGNLDINEVVQDVLKLMRNDLANQGVTVQTELAENLPAVQGDCVQLQQVLLNLMLNGCEAMIDCDSSERQLLITSGMENGAVHVSVTDRGVSVPEETMERVFEPFFTTKADGMGLGLSVCRTIIEAHRGNICVRNNAEGGATFHFSLSAR